MGAGEDEAIQGLHILLDQTQAASDGGLYLVALTTTLGAIDICGALGSENGRATGSKFRSWLVNHGDVAVPDAAQLWEYRCSLLHQTRNVPARTGSSPLAFMVPKAGGGGVTFHNLSTVVGDEKVGWMVVGLFVGEMVTAMRTWLEHHGDSNIVRKNLAAGVHLRSGGLPPHATGVPVIY